MTVEAPAANWRNRIVGSDTVEDPTQLLANPANWRIHPKHQQKAIAGALDTVGWVQQVMVNQRTGFVVDGHARIALAITRNEPVPVLYVDLSPEEEALVLATLDPIAAMANTDKVMLGDLLRSVSIDDEGLRALLGSLRRGLPTAGKTDPDEAPEPVAEPFVQKGELWMLGRHRILCGDATNPADVARLLGGEKPALMVTDPPYGVGYTPSWRVDAGLIDGGRMGEVTNDHRADWREAWALAPSDVAYVWHAGLFAGLVAESLASVGFELRSQIIWAKEHFPIGRGSYHWRHEPCWYAVRHGSTAHWIGDRKQTTVWNINTQIGFAANRTAENVTAGHGTTANGAQKPVECMERPLWNHSGDVYDPFVGSGTTVIAAERSERRCFAMELEPKYVQVSIERWQAFTGQLAVRA